MISRNVVAAKAGPLGSSTPDLAKNQIGLISLWFLSVWCGVVAGLLEVSTIVLRKQLVDPNHLFRMSRHFVWLIPLSNICVFSMLGLLGTGTILVWPRHGRWLFTRVMAALTVLPSLVVAFPRIHALAWLAVALGMAVRFVPSVECRSRGFRRFAMSSFPVAVSIVAIMGTSLWVTDWRKEVRENARPAPPAGSPNVLLIVMDTVAAGHLNLYGYHRATATTLAELAGRAVQFDSARAPSSWTLPSHATMFTGRWLHELSVGWCTPLDGTHPTLAEFLGDRGYATAGFIANTYYCAADSGLGRGFTRYEDFIFPKLTALKNAALVKRASDGFQVIVYYTEDWLNWAGLRPHVERLWQALDDDRKGAAVLNREFVDWLTGRQQPERPFFAFLNYYDAHYPYQLPPGRLHRFGIEPVDAHQRILIQQWGEFDKTTISPEGVAFAAAAYDDCIADLDEQLGYLVDELNERGALERTWLIIASDHGESFGEHAGVFCHGMSLYDTELHVPFLLIPPGGSATKRVIKEVVSLRDLAATIVDVAGQTQSSPFPGASLTRFWKQPFATPPGHAALALAEVVPNDPGQRDYWGLPKSLPPLGAVKENEWSYIRDEANVLEKLFNLRDDPDERHNLADDPAAKTTLQQMRAALDQQTRGPLLPNRFNP